MSHESILSGHWIIQLYDGIRIFLEIRVMVVGVDPDAVGLFAHQLTLRQLDCDVVINGHVSDQPVSLLNTVLAQVARVPEKKHHYSVWLAFTVIKI